MSTFTKWKISHKYTHFQSLWKGKDQKATHSSGEPLSCRGIAHFLQACSLSETRALLLLLRSLPFSLADALLTIYFIYY